MPRAKHSSPSTVFSIAGVLERVVMDREGTWLIVSYGPPPESAVGPWLRHQRPLKNVIIISLSEANQDVVNAKHVGRSILIQGHCDLSCPTAKLVADKVTIEED